METLSFDVRSIYNRFFELGAGPAGNRRPWAYRRQTTSLRLAGCWLLVDECLKRRASTVLDLGSGLTTHVLRQLAAVAPWPMTVTTTDTSRRWLETTVEELKRDGVAVDRCYLQEEFEALPDQTFDLISVDAGNTAWRIDQAPNLARWCAPKGVLVLDDFGMGNYAELMTEALERHHFTVTKMPDTLDEFGCYMATATRKNE